MQTNNELTLLLEVNTGIITITTENETKSVPNPLHRKRAPGGGKTRVKGIVTDLGKPGVEDMLLRIIRISNFDGVTW